MKINTKTDKNEILSILTHLKKDIFNKAITDVQLMSLAEKFATHAVFLVMTENDSDVGYVAFYCNNTEEKKAFISMIVVDSAYQGRGYGRKLLKEAEHIAREKGMHRIQLEVHRDNISAMRFYDRLGYVMSSQSERSFILEKTI